MPTKVWFALRSKAWALLVLGSFLFGNAMAAGNEKAAKSSSASGHGNGSHPETMLVPREPWPSEGHGWTHDRSQARSGIPAESELTPPQPHSSQKSLQKLQAEVERGAAKDQRSWFEDGYVWFAVVFIAMAILVFTLG